MGRKSIRFWRRRSKREWEKRRKKRECKKNNRKSKQRNYDNKIRWIYWPPKEVKETKGDIRDTNRYNFVALINSDEKDEEEKKKKKMI